MRALLLSRLLAVLGLAVAVPPASHAGAITYDFEDGPQGWSAGGHSFHGGPAPDELGGGNAWFGSDGSSISIELDVTWIRSVTIESFFTGSDPEFNDPFFYDIFVRTSDGLRLRLDRLGSLVATPEDPHPNPDRFLFGFPRLSGVHRVTISWPALVCTPEDPLPCLRINRPGWIDDVTFHTVPELTSGALLMFSLLGLAAARRGRS